MTTYTYNFFASIVLLLVIAGLSAPSARAEVYTTSLGETVETPDANLSIRVTPSQSDVRRGEVITYTMTFANASQTKTITTDLSLIFYNLDLKVASIQPKQFTGRVSNLDGYPWNFSFKSFQLKPLEKKTITFTATANPKAKIGERLRMVGVIQEGGFRDTEIMQLSTSYVVLTGGPVRSFKKVQVKDIASLFASVYGRIPTDAEKKYWIGRMKDKPLFDNLKGAMMSQKAHGKSPKVLGVKSNAIYQMRFSDAVSESAPGELVTYSIQVLNKDEEGRSLTPSVSVTTNDLEIPSVSDHGKRGKLQNGKMGDWVNWSTKEILNKKTHTFTFQVKTPNAIGEQYCVKVNTFPFLEDEDCNTIVKATKNKVVPTPKPVSKPAVKITSKDFRILGPGSLNTDRADQEITWYVTDAVKKKYPGVKIELCPGKDFKGCIILDAVAVNDGSQIINMPPVPRIGKWYLHLIARDGGDKLITTVQTSKLIVLHQ